MNFTDEEQHSIDHGPHFIDSVKPMLKAYNKREMMASKITEVLNNEAAKWHLLKAKQMQEDSDNFAIQFMVWALFDEQAILYRGMGITAAGLLEKYKDRPYIDNSNPSLS